MKTNIQVCFYGLQYGEQLKKNVGTKNTVSHAIQKFNRNLVDALKVNYKVKIISPVCTDQRIITKEYSGNMEYEYIKYHGSLGRIHLMCSSFCKTLRESRKVIIADALNISMTYGIVRATRYTHDKVVLVVTDIPDDVLQGRNTVYAKLFLKNLKEADGLIFLTEQANKDYNYRKVPFCIIEGIAKAQEIEPYPTKKKISVYAGGLNEKYYVKQLVDAFDGIAKENEILYIFGDGEAKEYIEKKSKESKNIEYMGTVNNEKVLRYEAAAELLINPRPDIGEYTKYSFPSKLIEYMTSGTPSLVNKLYGVPEIYYERLYLFSGYDMNSYKESLRKVLDIPQNEKKQLGESAKSFILDRNGIDAVAHKLQKLINAMI